MSAIFNSRKLAKAHNELQLVYPDSFVVLFVADRKAGGYLSYHISQGEDVQGITVAIANLILRLSGKPHLQHETPVVRNVTIIKGQLAKVTGQFPEDACGFCLYNPSDKAYQAWISNSNRQDFIQILEKFLRDIQSGNSPLPNMDLS